jgi:hypothetical protein
MLSFMNEIPSYVIQKPLKKGMKRKEKRAFIARLSYCAYVWAAM